MKRLKVIFFLCCILSTNLHSQEVISLLDGKVTFEIPSNDNIINVKEWQGSWMGQIEINPHVYDDDFFRTAELDYFPSGLEQLIRLIRKENRHFTNSELLDVLRTKQPFALKKYNNGFHKQSYSSINYNGKVIGESFFVINPLETSWPAAFGYEISIIVENKIISISIYWVDSESIVPVKLPEYFVKRNGEYYWKNNNAINQFYQQMNTATNKMPEQIQLLREAYNLILNSLRIKNFS